jgi:membrane-bound lytic murein transglycosylase B
MVAPLRLRTFAGFASVLLLAALPASAGLAQDADEAGFQGYLQVLAAKARGAGVSEATIARMSAGLTFNPKVIALDRSQPGGGTGGGTPPAFAPYRRQHVDSSRIARGQAMAARLSGIIPRIEARYGVPAPILLAIWGHETDYGGYSGDFDLARSLATLAYEGRRRDLFAGEYVALLKMVDLGVPPSQLKGSWAGAMGNPQFLPSMYLRVAADGDGDGRRDIWNDPADTLASIANYFRDAGWKRGEPWGIPASVPPGFAWSGLRSSLTAPVCAPVHQRLSSWKTVREWRRLGITPLANAPDSMLATLFQPDGPGTPAWLLTGNYRVILQYNCSNYYGLSVGLLADAIAR